MEIRTTGREQTAVGGEPSESCGNARVLATTNDFHASTAAGDEVCDERLQARLRQALSASEAKGGKIEAGLNIGRAAGPACPQGPPA